MNFPANREWAKRVRETVPSKGSSICKNPSEQQKNITRSPKLQRNVKCAQSKKSVFYMTAKKGESGPPQISMMHQFQLPVSFFLLGLNDTKEIGEEARG